MGNIDIQSHSGSPVVLYACETGRKLEHKAKMENMWSPHESIVVASDSDS